MNGESVVKDDLPLEKTPESEKTVLTKLLFGLSGLYERWRSEMENRRHSGGAQEPDTDYKSPITSEDIERVVKQVIREHESGIRITHSGSCDQRDHSNRDRDSHSSVYTDQDRRLHSVERSKVGSGRASNRRHAEEARPGRRTVKTTLNPENCRDESVTAHERANINNVRIDLGGTTLVVVVLLVTVIGACGVIIGLDIAERAQMEREFTKLDRQYRMTELKLDDWTVVVHRAGLQLPGDYTRGPQGNLDSESFRQPKGK